MTLSLPFTASYWATFLFTNHLLSEVPACHKSNYHLQNCCSYFLLMKQTLVGWGTACMPARSSAWNASMVLLDFNLPAVGVKT
jgi:hypothetical protein